MPLDGYLRDYTWEDVKGLLLKDMGLDVNDREYHDLWYIGNFREPEYVKDICIRIVKYDKDFRSRLEENAKEKI